MKIFPMWFRIHLSTALVLMIAASVLLGLNLLTGFPGFLYGWPIPFFRYDDDYHQHPLIAPENWAFKNLLADVVTATTLLIVIAIILEKRIAVLQRIKDEKDGLL